MSLNDEPQKWCKKCVKLTQIHENTWLMDLEIIQCRNTCGQSAGHYWVNAFIHTSLKKCQVDKFKILKQKIQDISNYPRNQKTW